MTHRNSGVKRRERAAERSRGVALHDCERWPGFFEDSRKGFQQTRREFRQGLSLSHDGEIEIRPYPEYRKHLIQHFAVLPGDANHRLNRPRMETGSQGAESADTI